MLDIDRLHRVVDRTCWNRGEGQTTVMLVNALQQSDFLTPGSHVVITAYSTVYAIDLMRYFHDLALQMVYNVEVDRARLRVRILDNGVSYHFVSRRAERSSPILEGLRIAILYNDHYYPD